MVSGKCNSPQISTPDISFVYQLCPQEKPNMAPPVGIEVFGKRGTHSAGKERGGMRPRS